MLLALRLFGLPKPRASLPERPAPTTLAQAAPSYAQTSHPLLPKAWFTVPTQRRDSYTCMDSTLLLRGSPKPLPTAAPPPITGVQELPL